MIEGKNFRRSFPPSPRSKPATEQFTGKHGGLRQSLPCLFPLWLMKTGAGMKAARGVELDTGGTKPVNARTGEQTFAGFICRLRCVETRPEPPTECRESRRRFLLRSWTLVGTQWLMVRRCCRFLSVLSNAGCDTAKVLKPLQSTKWVHLL